MAGDLEERREQIMGAALRVFSRKGFGKATMKDIAQEAEVTPGLIYYYFESKDALMQAIMKEIDPIVHEIALLSEQDFAQPVEVSLRALFTRLLDIAESEEFMVLIRVILSEVLHGENEAPMHVVSDLSVHRLQILVDYLDKKMGAGELRQTDSMQAVDVLMGCLISFVVRRQILHDPLALRYSHEQIATRVVDTVLHGLEPE